MRKDGGTSCFTKLSKILSSNTIPPIRNNLPRTSLQDKAHLPSTGGLFGAGGDLCPLLTTPIESI